MATMKKIGISVVTFNTKLLPVNSHGAEFPTLSEYLTKMQIVPTIGMEIGIEGKLQDMNSDISEQYEVNAEYVKVTRLTLCPWLDDIQVEVDFIR